jgi:hypothetical protein
LKENVISLILQVESGYHEVMEEAMEKAEAYAAESRQKQSKYLSDLEHEWILFEKTEQKKFDEMLEEEERRMEIELKRRKEQLKARQQVLAESISERLKKEVLSINGSR